MNADGTYDPDDPDDVCEHGESLGMYCSDCHWDEFDDDLPTDDFSDWGEDS